MRTNISCKRFKGIAIADDVDYRKVAQLRCKQWDCEYCAHHNRLQWRAAIIDYINRSAHDSWSFWTITVPDYVRKYDQGERYSVSLAIIQANWDTFMKRAKRHLGTFEYVRVLEQHKDSTLHVHLLASVHVPDSHQVTRQDGSQYYHSDWVKDNATDCHFGYIHDCRNLLDDNTSAAWHGGAVAAYVTKYMTKDTEENDNFRKKVRARKIQTSRGIKRVNLDSELTWSLKSAVYKHEIIILDRPHFDVTTGQVITLDHFRGGNVYPPIEDKD